MNVFYTHNTQFPDGKLAFGTKVDVEFQKVQTGFDLVGTTITTALVDLTTAAEFHTWTQNIDANGFFLNNVPDPVLNTDLTAVSASWVSSEISAQIIAGGSPGLVNITALNQGSATALQFIHINAFGNVRGFDPTLNNIGVPSGSMAGDAVYINGTNDGFTTASVASDRAARTFAKIYGYLTL